MSPRRYKGLDTGTAGDLTMAGLLIALAAVVLLGVLALLERCGG